MTLLERLREWRERYGFHATLILLAFLLFVAYFYERIFISIYPGEAGVLWKRLHGTVTERFYDEGFHIIAPWNVMYIYDVRFQEAHDTYDVLTLDGLKTSVDIAVRFRPIKETLPELHKNIGPEYIDTFVLPEVKTYFREQAAIYDLQQLYSEKREEIMDEVLRKTEASLRVSYQPESELATPIYFQDAFIQNIAVPPTVAQAIENKLAQEQLMLEYDYRLEKEEKERERKRIEAEGIRLFQDIVSEGISERYLKWKGIDATLDLAKSNNSKIVIIGGGEDGLPIILGPLDASTGPETAAPLLGTGGAASTGSGATGNPAGSSSGAAPPTASTNTPTTAVGSTPTSAQGDVPPPGGGSNQE